MQGWGVYPGRGEGLTADLAPEARLECHGLNTVSSSTHGPLALVSGPLTAKAIDSRNKDCGDPTRGLRASPPPGEGHKHMSTHKHTHSLPGVRSSSGALGKVSLQPRHQVQVPVWLAARSLNLQLPGRAHVLAHDVFSAPAGPCQGHGPPSCNSDGPDLLSSEEEKGKCCRDSLFQLKTYLSEEKNEQQRSLIPWCVSRAIPPWSGCFCCLPRLTWTVPLEIRVL